LLNKYAKDVEAPVISSDATATKSNTVLHGKDFVEENLNDDLSEALAKIPEFSHIDFSTDSPLHNQSDNAFVESDSVTDIFANSPSNWAQSTQLTRTSLAEKHRHDELENRHGQPENTNVEELELNPPDSDTNFAFRKNGVAAEKSELPEQTGKNLSSAVNANMEGDNPEVEFFLFSDSDEDLAVTSGVAPSSCEKVSIADALPPHANNKSVPTSKSSGGFKPWSYVPKSPNGTENEPSLPASCLLKDNNEVVKMKQTQLDSFYRKETTEHMQQSDDSTGQRDVGAVQPENWVRGCIPDAEVGGSNIL